MKKRRTTLVLSKPVEPKLDFPPIAIDLVTGVVRRATPAETREYLKKNRVRHVRVRSG